MPWVVFFQKVLQHGPWIFDGKITAKGRKLTKGIYKMIKTMTYYVITCFFGASGLKSTAEIYSTDSIQKTVNQLFKINIY